MTGINHALTGGLIATAIANPMIGLPVAFLSHFLLDVLPHFGEAYGKRSRLSKIVWIVDGVVVGIFVIVALVSGSWLFLLGALAGMSPDFAWIYRFTVQENFGKLPPRPENKFNQFHSGIQHFESRVGLLAEVVWLALLMRLLVGEI